jgi:ubiquinone/menaquinone biosynthesis C-methylase UbiE
MMSIESEKQLLNQSENQTTNGNKPERNPSNEPAQNGSISSAEYTRDYYLSSCQGHEEFISSKGKILPLRLSLPLELAQLSEGMQVIDIGCGRGEIIIHSAMKGSLAWGIDYAYHALELAKEVVNDFTDSQIQRNIGLQQADARKLPFSDASADVVFMLDVVEHLLPEELRAALGEVWRILKPGGQVVIHTMPNLWYYRIGYPIYRLLQRLRGESLPADPRQRWEYSHVHVNEQTPRNLKTALRASKFSTRVWLQSTVSYDYESNKFVRYGMEFLTSKQPFRYIFCNDIFATGLKS